MTVWSQMLIQLTVRVKKMHNYTNEELIKLAEFGEDIDYVELAKELAKRLNRKQDVFDKVIGLLEESEE